MLSLICRFSDRSIVTSTPIPTTFAKKITDSRLLAGCLNLHPDRAIPWTDKQAVEIYQQWQTWKQKLVAAQNNASFHLCFQLQTASAQTPDHWHPARSILIIGYAPSVLMAVCTAIEQGQIQPALVIGMPIGFSHAPAAKRRLMAAGVPYMTIQGSLGGGLLAAVAANALIASVLEKPDCHCHLKSI